MQPAGEHPGAGRLQLLVEDLDLLPGLLHLLVGHRVADLAVDAVDRQQVLRHGVLLVLGGHLPAAHPDYERASPRLTLGPVKVAAISTPPCRPIFGGLLAARRLAVIGCDRTSWFRLPDVQVIASASPHRRVSNLLP